ncbi:MAG: hypothetical protein ACREN8_01905 [Candidatus Dormibacteraceae bacterium]
MDEDLGEEVPSVVPKVSADEQKFEHRSELLSADQMEDGSSLVELLDGSSAEGWDLVEVISLNSGYLVLMRKPKRTSSAAKRVGFAWPLR